MDVLTGFLSPLLSPLLLTSPPAYQRIFSGSLCSFSLGVEHDVCEDTFDGGGGASGFGGISVGGAGACMSR